MSNELLRIVLEAIRKTELDCCVWGEEAKKELASEIVAAICVHLVEYERER